MSFLLIAGVSTGPTLPVNSLPAFQNGAFRFGLLMQDILVYSLIWLTSTFKYVMYALIMSFVRNQTMKKLSNVSFSITNVPLSVSIRKKSSAINSRLGRGSTIIKVEGGYSHQKQYMIILIIQQNELHTSQENYRPNPVPSPSSPLPTSINILGNFKEHSYEL